MCLSTSAGLSHSWWSAASAIANPFLAPTTGGGAICLLGPPRRATDDTTEVTSDWLEVRPGSGSSSATDRRFNGSAALGLALRLALGRGRIERRSVESSESEERYMSIAGEAAAPNDWREAELWDRMGRAEGCSAPEDGPGVESDNVGSM